MREETHWHQGLEEDHPGDTDKVSEIVEMDTVTHCKVQESLREIRVCVCLWRLWLERLCGLEH